MSFAGLCEGIVGAGDGLVVANGALLSLLTILGGSGGFGTIDGAYVIYPLPDILAQVVAASHRAQCLVVGENLSSFPEGMSDALSPANGLSYKTSIRSSRCRRSLLPDPELFVARWLITTEASVGWDYSGVVRAGIGRRSAACRMAASAIATTRSAL